MVSINFGEDTRATTSCTAQAYGSGNIDHLPLLFQRATLFLLAHCVAISGLMLTAPLLLRAFGEEESLCNAVWHFLTALLPLLLLDAVNR